MRRPWPTGGWCAPQKKKKSVGCRRKSTRLQSTQSDTVPTAATAEETVSPDAMKNQQSLKSLSHAVSLLAADSRKRHRHTKFSNSHALRVTTVFVQGMTELHIVSRRESRSENKFTVCIFSVIYVHFEYEQI